MGRPATLLSQCWLRQGTKGSRLADSIHTCCSYQLFGRTITVYTFTELADPIHEERKSGAEPTVHCVKKVGFPGGTLLPRSRTGSKLRSRHNLAGLARNLHTLYPNLALRLQSPTRSFTRWTLCMQPHLSKIRRHTLSEYWLV